MGERVFRILRTEKRRLPVKLSEGEWHAAAKRLAAISEETDAVDGQIEGIKSQVAGLKSRKEVLAVESRQTARLVRSGTEEREVEVAVEVEDGTNTVYERRTDTNEIVRERGLTAEEAQISLFHEVRETRPKDEDPDGATHSVDDEKEVKALPPGPKEKKKGKGKRKAKEATVDMDDLDKLDEEEREAEEDPVDDRENDEEDPDA